MRAAVRPREISIQAPPRLRLLCIVGIALFATALVRSSWVGDDAFITLRTIDNFWSGYGLRWNVLERVQAYTHPLWLMVVGAVYGVTREPYFTTLAVSWACTLGVLLLFFRHLPLGAATAALLLLTASRAFVNYCTSGLENPLSHLLLVAFWLKALEPPSASTRRLLSMGLLASLVALTRLDLLVLVVPGLIVAGRRIPVRRTVLVLAAAAIPLILWHSFTLVYYGFPFPNTAYAKLGHGVPQSAMLIQGLRYLNESLIHEPVTLATIGVAIAMAAWRPTAPRVALAGGMLLHLAYVVWVGGDFMSGRFLTPAFICAIVLLAHGIPDVSPRLVPATVTCLLALSVLLPSSPLRVWSGAPDNRSVWLYDHSVYHGITDERAYYYPYTGLIPVMRGARVTDHPWVRAARTRWGFPRVTVGVVIGLAGYYAGPAMHLIDHLGLADPLAARLPAAPGWRPGHFARELPPGYMETIVGCVDRRYPHGRFRPTDVTCLTVWQEVNQIHDRAIGHQYHELARITQGPIFDPARLWAIVRWNLGFAGR